MKKLFSLIVAILILSCSTSSDDNGNSNTTVVPIAPSNLIGTVASPTQINLSWTDNSTNETGFKIQRRTGSVIYSDVGTVNQDVLTFSDSGLLPSTTYIYRVYAYNAVGNSLTYSNEVTLTTTAITLPTLTTTTVSSITQTTSSSGGNISNDGGATITARGVCWSAIPIPTIALTTKTTNGAGTGTFISNISGLTVNTTYYLRAYATNSMGTAYGNEVSFTTEPPPTVTIGTQTWTTKNLDVATYSDGTPIPQVTDPTQWANLTTGAWCYYNNDPTNGAIYGKLYNWYAVAGIHDTDPNTPNKVLAPIGWHVPTDIEWTTLYTFLGGNSLAGGKMKSTGTSLWSSPNTAATNSSGFTGLPGGWRNYFNTFIFDSIGRSGFWWSSSENNISLEQSWLCYLGWSFGDALRYAREKNYGLSVRCVRD